MLIAALTSRSWTAPHGQVHSRTFSGISSGDASRTPSTLARSGRTGRPWRRSGRTVRPCTPAWPRTPTSPRRARSWPARAGQSLDRQVLHGHRLVLADDLWWRAGGGTRGARRSTLACCRATLMRALARLADPFSLRDSACCALLEFLLRPAQEARASRSSLPSDRTAKCASPRSIPISVRPSRAAARPAGLDHERGEVPARRVLDHRHRGRLGRQGPGPADRHVADLRQAQLPARGDLEAGVGGEPDRLPVVLAGPEPGRGDLRALPLARDRGEEVAVGRVQVGQGLLQHHG